MADVKISELPAASTPLAGTEQIPLVQDATTKQITVSNLLTSANLGTPSAINLANATNVPMDEASGVLAVANGGTGTATPALVQGTNVTITGTWPNQTINSTYSGAVTSVSAALPVVSSGGTTPQISMAAATTSVNGYLTSTDWNTFNSKLTSGGPLGTPSSGTATNLTGLPLTTGVTGLLPVANGGTGTATPSLVQGSNITITGSWPNQTIAASGAAQVYPGAGIANSTGSAWGTSYSTTGSGTVLALATSPTFVTPALGVPASGDFSTGTFTWPTFNQNTSGTAANITATSNSTLTTLSSLSLPGSQVSGNISGNAGNVSGIVAVANGGTGTATPSLVQGTNITITGTWPNQTIAASGGGGSGDVVGPSSSTDNALVRFDTTTGKLVQNSVGILSDTGAISGLTDISASGSVTLSGGTANGVTYLNGSKVLTSGSALTFDGSLFNVTTSGTTSATIRAYDATASKVYIQAGGASPTAAYVQLGVDGSNGTSYLNDYYGSGLAFQQSGTEQMRLTSTGLGIGTSSPDFKLVVAGNTDTRIRVDGSSSAGIYFTQGGSNAGTIRGTTSGLELYVPSTGLAATLNSSGNLGLGVTPSAWSTGKALEINTAGMGVWAYSSRAHLTANYYFNAADKFAGTGYAAFLSVANDGNFRWYQSTASGTAGNNATMSQNMTLDASGNLGLGNTSPTYLLDMYKTGRGSGANYSTSAMEASTICRVYGGENDLSKAATLTFTQFNASSAISSGYTATQDSFLSFGTSSIGSSGAVVERARIDSSGNLLVGVTGGTSGQRIYASAANGTTAVIAAVNTTSGNSSGYTSLLQSAANNTSSFHYAGTTLGVANWYLYGNGTSSWSSDERLKKNIVTTRDGYLEDVCKLRVVKYQWKTGPDQVELGLIAQEVEQVFPALVQDDLNTISPDDPTIYKQLKGSVLPIILLKAIQEQQAIISAQATVLESLKARLDAANL